jgi:hypothetical protein
MGRIGTYRGFDRLLGAAAALFLTLALALTLAGCGSDVVDKTQRDGFQVDHDNPSSVVEAIFVVAKGADAKILGGLCDPNGQVDLDVRRICEYAHGFDPEGEFPMFFGEGKVAGPHQILGDRAWVPFLFGPNGDKRDTIQLVRREGKWYLEQFLQ